MHSHIGYELGRRDDMESYMFLLVYLATGQLPWLNQHVDNTAIINHGEMIREHKVSLKAEVLCGELPIQLRVMFEIVRDLDFEDKPNYDRLRKGLKTIIGNQNYHKPVFDWHKDKDEREDASSIDKVSKGGGTSNM